MTLFTLLLVLAWERLFKLGEHWQLDHRFEVIFRRGRQASLAKTLAIMIIWMVIIGEYCVLCRGSSSVCQR